MNVLWVMLAAFALAVPLVLLARIIALRYGIVDKPRAGRESKAPRPYLGGVAIGVAAVVACSVTWLWQGKLDPTMLAVLVAVTVCGLIGLSDDLRQHSARPKLLGEFLVATLVVSLGGTIAITEIPAVDVAISLFAIVLLTNSFNLLDNSDGALSSIAVITGLGITAVAVVLGGMQQGFLAAAVAGACLAFLLFNWHPASIFMGDAGSLFVGCALVCSLALLRGTDTPPSIPVALGLVLIPLVDTTLVFITRRREGRSFMAGGVDHLHHRFNRTSLGVRGGAAMLSSICAVGAAISIAVAAEYLNWVVALMILVSGGACLLAIALRLPSEPESLSTVEPNNTAEPTEAWSDQQAGL